MLENCVIFHLIMYSKYWTRILRKWKFTYQKRKFSLKRKTSMWQFYVFHTSWKINIPGYVCKFENTIEKEIFSEHRWTFLSSRQYSEYAIKTVVRYAFKMSLIMSILISLYKNKSYKYSTIFSFTLLTENWYRSINSTFSLIFSSCTINEWFIHLYTLTWWRKEILKQNL